MQRANPQVCFAFILLLCSGVTLAGCSSLYQSLAARLTPSPSPFLPTGTVEVVVDSTVAFFETPVQEVDCAFAWSNHSLLEVSTEVNLAFRKEGFPEVEVEASAYGKDCLDPETNRVVRFMAMQTDFYINVGIDGANNPQVMGEWVERTMRVLESFPPGKVPGTNPGYIGLSFTSGLDTVSLWFARSKGKNLIEEGFKGSELYEVLRGP